MTFGPLILKRARPSPARAANGTGDDFDLLVDGVVVGRIMQAAASPGGRRGCGRWPAGALAAALGRIVARARGPAAPESRRKLAETAQALAIHLGSAQKTLLARAQKTIAQGTFCHRGSTAFCKSERLIRTRPGLFPSFSPLSVGDHS
jgi:hypothetical protein